MWDFGAGGAVGLDPVAPPAVPRSPGRDAVHQRVHSVEMMVRSNSMKMAVIAACSANRKAFLAGDRSQPLQVVAKLRPGFPTGFEYGNGRCGRGCEHCFCGA